MSRIGRIRRKTIGLLRRINGIYATADVVRICFVSKRQVTRWFHTGFLPGYTTPGGKHRITRQQLIIFLKLHELSLGELASYDTEANTALP